jgi:hypothetical protein
MTTPSDHPAPPPRPWRPMAAWTAGIVLALGLVWFVGAVVAPVWQVRRELQQLDMAYNFGVSFEDYWPIDPVRVNINRLGGPNAAATKLDCYLRLKPIVTGYRGSATRLLGRCGRPALPRLIRLLSDSQSDVRFFAALALGEMGADAEMAGPALQVHLADEEQFVRTAAAEALKKIRGEEATK